VSDAGAFDHGDRALELHWRRAQVGEQRSAAAEHDRYELDADLVEQTGFEALPCDLAAVDADVLVAGDL
jgi:hypothetical protein